MYHITFREIGGHSSNRTKVELKCATDTTIPAGTYASNRTKVELKYVNYPLLVLEGYNF